MKNVRLWIGALLALLPVVLSALEITLSFPRDGATVPLLNDKHKAFLTMPHAERVKFFADAGKRKQLIKAGFWPRPVYFAWKSAAAGDTKYRVLVSESPDMKDVQSVTGEKGKAKLYNLMLGRTYYWQVEAATSDGKTVRSAVRSFTTESQAPRLIRFPDVPNVRDLGGRPGRDGMYVKQGLVFRTAGMNENAKRLAAKSDEEAIRTFPEYRAILGWYRELQKQLKDDPDSVRVVPCSLKSKWVVFRKDGVDLSADEMKSLDTLATIPGTLFGAKPKTMTANKRGRLVIPENGPGPHTAVLMQEFDSPSDGIMQIASGGNWYWCVRVNGQLVFTRMQGNGKGATTSNYHYFVPVRKGKNLIVVVLKAANSGGWMWCCGKRRKQDPAANIEANIKALYTSAGGRQKGRSRSTPEGRKIFLGQFGVKSDIDLRSDGECWGMTGSPLGPEVKWFHYSSSAYARMQSERGKAAFAKVFRVFLDERNYPIAFHCIAGQDRTGAVAFILNGLLGVSEEELSLDWEATGFWNRNPKFNHELRYDKLVAGFRKLPGKDLHEQIENYVLSCGFTRGDIEKFRRIMLEKR